MKWKYQKSKTLLTEIKIAFNKLISGLDEAKERRTKPKDTSIETS